MHLIESPVFLKLRLQLVDPSSRLLPELLRTLYGILMILPQSESYKILSARLQACSALHAHLNFSYALSNNAPDMARRSNVERISDKSLITKKVTAVLERASQGFDDSTVDLIDYFTKTVKPDNGIAGS